ncbi:MAG TPA: MAPEG family protein [Caulobacteraceae bacterium]|jgi:hypothetical protein
MPQEMIFWPMVALAALTLGVLTLVPRRRFRAARMKQVDASDFRLGESQRVPPEVAVANRNYMNLLELPVLFYVVCLAFHAAGAVDLPALVLAWAFVALRVAHSAVHLSSNNVMHRLRLFGLSVLVLAATWVWFAVKLV